jgi:hypothetical protein
MRASTRGLGVLVLPDARETSAWRYGRFPRRGAQAGSSLEERTKPKPGRLRPLAAGRGPSNITSGRTAGSGAMSDSMFRWIGFRADSEGSVPGFFAMAFRTGVVAAVGSGIYCYGLAYESRQEPARQRGLLKAQKIRERLGSNASMLDDFPNKPRGCTGARMIACKGATRRRTTIADNVDGVCRSIRRTSISAWIGLQSPAYHVLNYVRPTRTCTRGSCGPGSCQ